MVNYIPEKGDIIHLSFYPAIGHEQKGNRYTVVISHFLFNKFTGMCYAVPISSKYKGYPRQVEIKVDKIKGRTLIDQSKSIDYKARKANFKD